MSKAKLSGKFQPEMLGEAKGYEFDDSGNGGAYHFG
jgi:hypothetical protein